MTKYILHGGFTSIDNELNRAFYQEVASDIPDHGTVLLCYFAARDRDSARRFAEDSEKITQQSNSKTFNFLLADEENFISQLERSDVLYLRGGSTPKLLNSLHTYKDLKDRLVGKTMVGSSAGAYVIGTYSAFHDDDSGGIIREGLGLLPLRVVCHYESADLPPNPDALATLKSMEPELDLIILRDFEHTVIRT